MLRFTLLIGVVVSVSMALAGCGGGSSARRPPVPPPPAAGLSTGPEACVGGTAGDFSCSGISLRQRVSLESMNGTVGNDIWGWVDALSGDEYALMGMSNGTAFINITDPENPVFLGNLPTATVESAWRDIKVYQNHAFIINDVTFFDWKGAPDNVF